MINTTPYGKPDKFLTIRGTQIPYWKVGEGPDLVFVHGWPLDARTWRKSVETLRHHYTCHLFDLPGAGLSQWDESTRVGVGEYGDVVVDIVKEVTGSRPIGIVGHDSGGTFARLAAAKLGAKVVGMVCGNTEIPGYHPPRLALLLPALRSPVLASFARYMLKSRLGRYAMMRDAVANTDLIEAEMSPLFLDPLRGSRRAWAGALMLPRDVTLADFDLLSKAHPELHMPVHLVWGARDPYFPVSKVATMMDSIPGDTTLHVVPDAKLLVHEEEPLLFANQTHNHFKNLWN